MCNNCIHKIVCSKYIACGEVKTCEHFKEDRKGKWVKRIESGMYWYECSACGGDVPRGGRHYRFTDFCPNCGADMRGNENGKTE